MSIAGKHISDLPHDIREYLRKKDQIIEKVLDVTFVDIKFYDGGNVELIHPASGEREVFTIPKAMKDPEERLMYVQERCSHFVKEKVKPHG